jgi:hypothetical protein
MRPGENLQRLVRALEQATNNAPNIRVESPKRLPDKDTGQPREHDVVLTFALSHHTVVMALECRDRSRKVGVPDVEAFRRKCDRTGVHRAIIVSATGFTKTALKKAANEEIGCLGLEEVPRFDWCRAPAIEYYVRNLLPGPNWMVATATPITGKADVYDAAGNKIDAGGFTNIAFDCLNQRPPEISKAQDDQARSRPVLCVFENQAASAFHVIDESGRKIPVTRMIIKVLYETNYTLIPFSFHEYFDYAKGKTVSNAAIANVDHGSLKGDFVMQRDELTGVVTITYVPPSS